MDKTTWFERLWDDYVRMTPNVSKIPSLLSAGGETIVNDHVAFRTFDVSPLNIENLRRPLESLGFLETGRYHFREKRVDAVSFSHPDGGARIFLSELRTSEFIHQEVFSRAAASFQGEVDVATFWCGRPWPAVSFDLYQTIRRETEYGAWVLAMGLRPNHFTISVNALSMNLNDLVPRLESEGYRFNVAGGAIKGSEAIGLEQASTMADRVDVEFADGRYEVPTCYYEFAMRYASETPPVTPEGLFDGFVTSSADKIFESTDDAT